MECNGMEGGGGVQRPGREEGAVLRCTPLRRAGLLADGVHVDSNALSPGHTSAE